MITDQKAHAVEKERHFDSKYNISIIQNIVATSNGVNLDCKSNQELADKNEVGNMNLS